MPHDAGVAEQTTHVTLTEAGNLIGVEAGEGGTKVLPLPEDRQPREAGLEAFETQTLVDTPFGRDRPSPLLVVVGEVQRIGRFPAAFYVSTTSTLTTPSSTVTG